MVAILEVIRSFAAGVLVLAVLLGACAPATEPILVDSYFSGQALLDANGNGQIDPVDSPVENATFIVAVQGGAEFGGFTDETGHAFIIIPSAVEYPVTLRMEAPKDSALKLIGPSTVTFYAADTSPRFLFSSK